MKKKGIASTQNSKDIKATPEVLYRAFTTPEALAVWLAPGEMTGKIHKDVNGGHIGSQRHWNKSYHLV